MRWLPDTPVGRQIAWVIERINSGEETDVSEIEEHFAPAFLGAIPVGQVQRIFRELGGRGLDALEIEQDPQSPYVLRGSGRIGTDRVLIGAQTEREEPYRLIMLMFRPGRSLKEIFAETPGILAPLPEILDEHVGSLIERLAPGGVLAGIVRRDETHIGSFGPVSVDELFEVGSVTKPFTGTLLAEMVVRGEVALEDPAAKFFPQDVIFPRDTSGREIRLIDLATHSASLPRLPPDWEPADPADPYADFTVETLYASLEGVVLDVPIGTTVRYSNYGFAILGHALSLAAGSSYADLVVQRVCNPLGMSDTGIEIGESSPGRRARGYGLSGEEMPWWHRPVFAPAGGITTTIADLTRFLRAQLDPHSTPLATPILETQAPLLPSGENAYVGLAWQIVLLPDGKPVVWHNGQTGGFTSAVFFHPDSGAGVVALSNTSSNRLDQRAATILAAMLNAI